MRVTVAHDSLMLCEGSKRLLTGHDMEVIGTTPPTSCEPPHHYVHLPQLHGT